jgi:hypothetical protein
MKIQYEDRTEETAEQVLARRTELASHLLIMTAIHVSDATPAVGIGGLSLALGQAAARTGADIDEILTAVRAEHERVQALLAHRSEGTDN